MSTSNPLITIIEQQRRVIEQTQRVALGTVAAQQTAVRQVVSGLETTKQLQTRGNELKRETLHTAIDTVEQATPAADLTASHQLVDEGIDLLVGSYEQQWETAIDGIQEFETAAEEYSETVDDSFDRFLDAQAGIEDETAMFVEQVESVLTSEVAAD